jgi:hypothetical protein
MELIAKYEPRFRINGKEVELLYCSQEDGMNEPQGNADAVRVCLRRNVRSCVLL